MYRRRSLATDLAFSGLLPLVAIWLYETSNLVVLVAQGSSVSFSMSGWIPAGVAGISSSNLSPLTKVAQMALSIGLLVPLRSLFSKFDLRFAETLATSMAGVYLASAYWELLSVLNYVNPEVHVTIFVAGTAVTVLCLLKLASQSETTPHRTWHSPKR